MVKVFSGSNFYLLKSYVDKAKADFVAKNGDMAVEEIDCEEADINTLANAIQSASLFSAKKLIIARDIAKNKALSEQVEKILELAEHGNDLVIVEKDIDKRSLYYKFLKKNSDLTECEEPDENQLVEWLCKEAKAKGANLPRQEARYLVGRIGQNQQLLKNELYKLLAYNEDITRENIDKLTVEKPQSSIFNLIDAAFAGHTEATLKIYEEQKAQGAQPQSIFGMVIWQANIIAAVSAGNGLSTGELSAATGLKPFSIDKASRVYKKIGRSGVNNLLNRLVETDRQMKTRSADADELLKNLLVTIS